MIFTQNTDKELWRSDGTTLVTQQVRNLEGFNDGLISALIKKNVYNRYLNFSGSAANNSNSEIVPQRLL